MRISEISATCDMLGCKQPSEHIVAGSHGIVAVCESCYDYEVYDSRVYQCKCCQEGV